MPKKLDKKYTSIQFSAKIKPIRAVNEEFTLCKVYVQGIGKNRNFTYMSKESVEKALVKLPYCPVVAHLIEKEDGTRYVGGHDFEITDDWEFKDLTVPFGVVIDNSFEYETVNEYGTDVEYLTANVYLWTTRYPELKEAIYSEDVWFNQSMELNMENGNYRPYEEDSNYMELLDWTYSALCLLGKSDNPEEHTEPCFISSNVAPVAEEFSLNKFAVELSEMKEKVALLLNQQSNKKVDDIDKSAKGGTDLKKDEKFEESAVEEVSETEVEESNADETPEEETVEVEEVEKTETNEAEVDETKVEEVETDEETTDETDEYSLLKQEYETYKETHSTPNEEVDELRTFKTKALAAQRALAESEVFEQFNSKLGDVEEFKQLRENCSELSIEEIEDKCYSIIGRQNTNFSAKKTEKFNSVKLPVDMKEDKQDDGYGGILSKKYEA